MPTEELNPREMELHEQEALYHPAGPVMYILKVVGGWIYYSNAGMAYVPDRRMQRPRKGGSK